MISETGATTEEKIEAAKEEMACLIDKAKDKLERYMKKRNLDVDNNFRNL